MEYEVIDDFVPDEEFKVMCEEAESNELPWYCMHGVSAPGDGYTYFAHSFYFDNTLISDRHNLFVPLINRIDPASLLRAKINRYVNNGKHEEHPYHIDYDFQHLSCIFFLNTCNGHTKIKNGPEIKSVANRALIFDTSIPHASTNCTDEPYRLTMNVNFFPKVMG